MSHRIPVDDGVVILRRRSTWWIDAHQDTRRVRKPLRTSSKQQALAIAREQAGEIASRRWNVGTACDLTVESAVARAAAQPFVSPLDATAGRCDFTRGGCRMAGPDDAPAGPIGHQKKRTCPR